MKCEDFENNVNDLAREQMMDARVREQAFVHRDECPACAQRLAEESALSFKLRALAAEAGAEVVPQLRPEVLAALHERHVPVSVRTRSRFRTIAFAATATAAAAAIILVAFAVGFVRSGSPTATVQNPKRSQDLPTEKIIVKAPMSVTGPKITTPAPKLVPVNKAVGRNFNRNVERNSVTARVLALHSPKDSETASVTVSYSPEVSTEFFPVGYGSAPSLGDGGQLVRVELPRSTLVAFGVPMNVNRYDERVKADVLFGADGMAHAIRFVQ